MNADDSSSPTTTDGCEICGCPSCPPGYRVTIPDAIVQWESLEVPEEVSCAYLEQEMFRGQQQLLETNNDHMVDVCSSSDTLRLDTLFRSTCGCPALPTDNDADLLSSETTTVTNPIITEPAPLIRSAESIDPGTILLGDDPVAVVRQHPLLVACIVVGAFAVAGIYLVCQLRCTKEESRSLKEEDEEQVVQVAATSTTLSKDMDRATQEETGATDHTTTEADQYGDELQFQYSTPGKMMYIMTDDLESVSDYGSVVSSYNVPL